MQISKSFDYALRVLIYLARHPEGRVTISAISKFHGISHSHLAKIVNRLTRLGLVHGDRGRGGGIHLRRGAREISVGAVFVAVEEFSANNCLSCADSEKCRISAVWEDGMYAMIQALERVTIADLILPMKVERSRQLSVDRILDGVVSVQ